MALSWMVLHIGYIGKNPHARYAHDLCQMNSLTH